MLIEEEKGRQNQGIPRTGVQQLQEQETVVSAGGKAVIDAPRNPSLVHGIL